MVKASGNAGCGLLLRVGRAYFTVEKNRPATFTNSPMQLRRRLPHVVAVADWAAGGGVEGGGDWQPYWGNARAQAAAFDPHF